MFLISINNYVNMMVISLTGIALPLVSIGRSMASIAQRMHSPPYIHSDKLRDIFRITWFMFMFIIISSVHDYNDSL